MHRLGYVFVAAFLSLGLATSAMAAGPYVSLMGGAVFVEDSKSTDNTGAVITTDFDPGILLSGSAGYAFFYGLRIEGEISYRQADFDRVEFTSGWLFPPNGSRFPADGQATAFSVMANAAYDFYMPGGLKPYVLAGIGFAEVSVDLSYQGMKFIDDDDTVFAYQVGGGIAFTVAPNVDLFVDYRYFGTSDPSFTDVDGFTFKSEIATHNISAGVRFTL